MNNNDARMLAAFFWQTVWTVALGLGLIGLILWLMHRYPPED